MRYSTCTGGRLGPHARSPSPDHADPKEIMKTIDTGEPARASDSA